MKNQETNAAQMDEIVFEHRNKKYGAYILRRMYNKQLARALFLASAILIAALAYPLASSYNSSKGGRQIIDEGGIIFINPVTPPIETPVVPPPPPPVSDIQKRLVFTQPVVVPGDFIGEGELPTMDEFNDNQTSIPLDVSVAASIEKQPKLMEEPESKKEIFITAEEMPSYSGGETERMKFLADNIKYPQQAAETGIQGTIYIQFVVDSKGNITDVTIMRGIGGGCDEEAVRVIKMMPKWHPGRQNGQTVRVRYTMPVVFKLQG